MAWNGPAYGRSRRHPAGAYPSTGEVRFEQSAGGASAGAVITCATVRTAYVAVTAGNASPASLGDDGQPTRVGPEDKLDLAATTNWIRRRLADIPRRYPGGIGDQDVADIAACLQQFQCER